MNVGVLGAGFIVPIFISETKKSKGFYLRALWARNKDKLEPYKADFDYVTNDINKLLNDPKIEVIYIALPNSLHYEYALMCLKHGKHIIIEKPMTVTLSQTKKLFNFASKRNLMVYEAMMTIHNPLYKKIKKYLDKIGDIKIIEANFSQYSRRYEKFKNGIIAPAFDYKLAGGSLMDINVYNISFVTGLFGKPKSVKYYPNVINKIDTSGVLILNYDSFIASLISSKDSRGKSYINIQGDNGYIRCNSTASRCSSITIQLNNGKKYLFEIEDSEFVGWKYELKDFKQIFNNNSYSLLKEYNDKTIIEIDTLEKALLDSNLIIKKN